MSAAALTAASLSVAHRQFVDALPAMDRTFRFMLRRFTRPRRAEAVAEARAAAWHAWHGLLARGQDPLAVGPTGIAANAARYVKAGRRLGTGTSGRGAMDIFNRRAQRLSGFKLVSMDRDLGPDRGAVSDAWREWLAGDNSVSPADEAAFRIDFQEWLDGLPGRDRRVAELLATGEATGAVARMVGVSSGRVSQLRRELAESWGEFQGEAGPVARAHA
jgi:hypothetical protein